MLSYVIMARLGQNLESILIQGRMNQKSIYGLGIHVVNILQQIHMAGYVHNDLKFDNLLLDYNCNTNCNTKALSDKIENIFFDNSVSIIDFGFVTKYLDLKTKEHITQAKVKVFRGNIIFSSANQLNFMTTSRKDDMISLFYMLVFLLQEGQISVLKLQKGADQIDELRRIKLAKEKHTTADLCFGPSADLVDFKNEVFSYGFNDQPRYDFLKGILSSLIGCVD